MSSGTGAFSYALIGRGASILSTPFYRFLYRCSSGLDRKQILSNLQHVVFLCLSLYCMVMLCRQIKDVVFSWKDDRMFLVSKQMGAIRSTSNLYQTFDEFVAQAALSFNRRHWRCDIVSP